MKRFGPLNQQMCSMNGNDVFLLRLQLLIVIVRAALKGYPVGEFRKKAALENASAVHSLVLELDLSFLSLKALTPVFRERVKLLSIMAAAIVSEEYPLGIYRRQAVLDNIEIITQYGFPQKKFQLFHDILKVA